MKKHSLKLFSLALILAVSAVIVSAGTAPSSRAITFDVPFDFQIGNEKYPAGKYRVSRENQNVVVIEDLEGTTAKILLGGSSGDALKAFDQSNLTFYKYGNRYFLRKVNSPTISVYVGVSRDEKEVRGNGYDQLARVILKADKK
jgi:hypothetical protein